MKGGIVFAAAGPNYFLAMEGGIGCWNCFLALVGGIVVGYFACGTVVVAGLDISCLTAVSALSFFLLRAFEQLADAQVAAVAVPR